MDTDADVDAAIDEPMIRNGEGKAKVSLNDYENEMPPEATMRLGAHQLTENEAENENETVENENENDTEVKEATYRPLCLPFSPFDPLTTESPAISATSAAYGSLDLPLVNEPLGQPKHAMMPPLDDGLYTPALSVMPCA